MGIDFNSIGLVCNRLKKDWYNRVSMWTRKVEDGSERLSRRDEQRMITRALRGDQDAARGELHRHGARQPDNGGL